jgi:hypothetical protein
VCVLPIPNGAATIATLV